jgi:hypothetical protein
VARSPSISAVVSSPSGSPGLAAPGRGAAHTGAQGGSGGLAGEHQLRHRRGTPGTPRDTTSLMEGESIMSYAVFRSIGKMVSCTVLLSHVPVTADPVWEPKTG